MRVGVIGINAKSSELSLREHLAKATVKLFGREALDELQFGSLFLSTCHRTEIYFSSLDLAAAHSMILQLLRLEIDLPFEHKLYSYFGEECFVHLAQVVAGLDSVIIGESEIQRQVKKAYEDALLYRFSLPRELHFLFQKSFKIAKELRSSAFFPKGSISLESSIFHLFEQFGNEECPILFVGNSAINRKILAFFRKKGRRDLTLCTRGVQSACELLQDDKLKIIDWHELETWPDFPLVICGTNQSNYLMTASQLHDRRSIQTRLVVDLSVPRNVDPQVGRHPQITLFNIEEIGQLLRAKEDRYMQEILLCKEKLSALVGRQLYLFQQKEEGRVLCTA